MKSTLVFYIILIKRINESRLDYKRAPHWYLAVGIDDRDETVRPSLQTCGFEIAWPVIKKKKKKKIWNDFAAKPEQISKVQHN